MPGGLVIWLVLLLLGWTLLSFPLGIAVGWWLKASQEEPSVDKLMKKIAQRIRTGEPF